MLFILVKLALESDAIAIVRTMPTGQIVGYRHALLPQQDPPFGIRAISHTTRIRGHDMPVDAGD